MIGEVPGQMSGYRKAKRQVHVSPGESVRIIRELQELDHEELSELTGLPQSAISEIEKDQVSLSVKRAKVLARALKCHPAVLSLFSRSATGFGCAAFRHRLSWSRKRELGREQLHG